MKAFAALLLFVAGWAGLSAQDYSSSILTNLPGMGLEVRPLNIDSESFALTAEQVEARVAETMESLDLRRLSAVELDVMPGQPYLEVSVDLAHAQGPSHLYVVRLELREMAQLERPQDRIVTVSVPTWERKMLGVANRPEAIFEAIDRLLKLYADEYRAANVADEEV